MKMMFQFEAAEEEFIHLVGDTVHTKIQGPDMHFALARKTFTVSPDIWYTLGFDYKQEQMIGRVFIDTYRDTNTQMSQVYQNLERSLKRKIRGLSYNPAATWEGSVDGRTYATRTEHKTFAGLSGFISVR